MELSKNIKELRQLNNMTQEKLAKKLNMSAQNISKWEQGVSEPSLSDCIKMVELFNVSLDCLVGENFDEYDFLKFESKKERKFNDKLHEQIKTTFPIVKFILIFEFNKDHDKEELDKILNLKSNYAFTKSESTQFRKGNYTGRQEFILLSFNENLQDINNRSGNKINVEIQNLKSIALKEKIDYLYNKREELKNFMTKYDGTILLNYWATYSTPFFDKLILNVEHLQKLCEMNIKFRTGIGNDYYELKKYMDTMTID